VVLGASPPTTTTATSSTTTTATVVRTATRPATGVIFQRSGYFGGLGQLAIDNKVGNQDGVVILRASDDKTYVAWVYVRNGARYTLKGIRDGNYRLYFTIGTGWEAARWQFRIETSYERVTDPDPLSFSTTSSEYTTWTMTLYSSSCTSGCMQSEHHAPLPPPHP